MHAIKHTHKMPRKSQDSPAVHTRSEPARLDKLPVELITLIANDLDTKSLKQLRLSCSWLAAASSDAFGHRLACVPFWFMQTSMQRLALLSESRWNKRVKTLAIMSSCPERGECENLDIAYPRALWSFGSPQMRHYNLHMRRVRLAPARAASETRFGTMPNVRTLVLNLVWVYKQDVVQHRVLPELYSALPNLTTLQLLRVDISPAYTDTPAGWLVSLALPSCIPSLRCLCIIDSSFQTFREVIDVVRAHRHYLRSVEVRKTSSPCWLDLLHVLRHELPLLENIVFKDNEHLEMRMLIEWPDGTQDTGEHAREMVREKGVKWTLDAMIAYLDR